MAKLDLTQYGITGSTVIAHNPSYEYLFEGYGGLLRNIRMTTTP